MYVNLIASQFTLADGFYYSPSFQQDSDEYITVALWNTGTATVSMEHSINDIDWIAVPDSTFSVTTSGLQTFAECQHGLYYRVKTTVEPSVCQILV